MATLRERRRQELHGAIMDAARRRLEQEGVAGLVLRAIARDLDVAVSALYRYVASRDDLITELLVETFTEHADAVDAAVEESLAGADVAAAMTAGLQAYRSWAVANPARFGLAYGAPVPGYRAPAERTVAAAARPGDRLMALLGQAHEQGRLDLATLARRAATLDPGVAADLEELRRRRGYSAPTAAIALATDLYVRVHGQLTMEVFGQLGPLVRHPDAYFRETLAQGLADLGLIPPA